MGQVVATCYLNVALGCPTFESGLIKDKRDTEVQSHDLPRVLFFILL